LVAHTTALSLQNTEESIFRRVTSQQLNRSEKGPIVTLKTHGVLLSLSLCDEPEDFNLEGFDVSLTYTDDEGDNLLILNRDDLIAAMEGRTRDKKLKIFAGVKTKPKAPRHAPVDSATQQKRSKPESASCRPKHPPVPREDVAGSLTSAPTANASHGQTLEIPDTRPKERALLQFEDVKKPLEMAGFVFRQHRCRSFFCRPGMDPKQNKSAVPGQDYFGTSHAFRENLCAYGLEDCNKWTEDNRYEVNTWVRYSIAGSHRYMTHIPVLPDITTGAKAWSILKNLGFFHLYHGLGDNWGFPGEQDGILGTTKFDNEKEFYDRLIRFGFPETCTFDRITDNERIMLENFLAEKGRVLTL
jgi:hypothetical protein